MGRTGAPGIPGEDRAGTGVEVGGVTPVVTGAMAGSPRSVPLTERILSGLPGPRPAWVVVWGLVPWLNLAVVWASGTSSWSDGVPWGEILNRMAVTFAVLLSLWGAARIGSGLRRLQQDLARVVEQEEQDVERLFGRVDSVVVPLLLTAAVGVLLPVDEVLRGQQAAGLIQAATWVFIGVPLATALWVYLTLQIGLNRLGRGHLTLQGYRGDRSLGLQPVGTLAFTGFWTLFGSVGPLVLTGSSDLPVVVVGIGVLMAGLGLFFLSLQNLHRQMLAVKQVELQRALTLYQEAYEQVQQEPTLDVLQRQAGPLGAAESLEKRAERIQEWPFDEATFARVVTIASSVAAVIIARLILAPAGL